LGLAEPRIDIVLSFFTPLTEARRMPFRKDSVIFLQMDESLAVTWIGETAIVVVSALSEGRCQGGVASDTLCVDTLRAS
jgi:hypothetical protein